MFSAVTYWFRYASLFFIFGVDADDNELLTLESIHFFVELLDKYFGNGDNILSPLLGLLIDSLRTGLNF